ncbi:hypothetical protein ABH999_003651 [Bradyrhizobium yuanmingense]|uniref:hypothetical protein n=1 Tax=Bradyrhizobium yuanmingense TaxID=108015 RepID=UPI003517599F
MRVCLIDLGSWLLLNFLFVLIVIPPRKSSPPKPLVRVIGAIKNLFEGPKNDDARPAFSPESREVRLRLKYEPDGGNRAGSETVERSSMTSERKIEANRRNAKRSTGPKTEVGKAKSSRNARQHGLSRSTHEHAANASPLARAIAGGLAQQHGSLNMDDLVRANLLLGRIRQARHDMLVALLECASPKLVRRLAGLERYERPVRAAQRRVLKRWLEQG